MKRFLVSILVPAAAAIAVVGSGFSVWYFGDKEVKTDSSASLTVKNMLHIGTFQEMSSSFKLTLDQTSEGRTKALELAAKTGDDLKTLEMTGITLTNSDTTKQSKIVYESPKQVNAVDSGTFADGSATANVKVKITTTFTVKEALANWIVVNKKDGTSATPLVATGAGDKTFTYVWTEGVKELDLLSGISFSYAPTTNQYTGKTGVVTNRGSFATCEPLNAAEYDIMYQQIKGITTDAITINTVATLVK